MSEQRNRILDCACGLYLSDGLDGFSMRKLAKEVGVTAPAIYRHYDGREAVLADVLREAHRTFSRYLYAALGAPSPLERFMAAGEQYLNFVIEHPRWYSMMHTAPEHLGMDEVPDDIEALQQATSQFWLDRVRECMDTGVLRKGDPEEASMTMWAHAHGMVQLYQQGCLLVEADDFRALFKASGRRLMMGVATREFAEELARMMAEESEGVRRPDLAATGAG
ncbi:MAG: TetR/AcrR family transcriptional regulator [Gemmatimonadetes bacterium]|nr:TetR/AcrR family transcriptional regulator [Gemmatimonadota bacterium]NNF15087.1 TetR/AcrR family transcriptional regulator [Gemmatimonadota bacterium]